MGNVPRRRGLAITVTSTAIKPLLVACLSAIGMIFSTGTVFGELPIDLSGAQVQITGPETLRFSHVTAPGYSGTYWGTVKWDPVSFTFVRLDYGEESNDVYAKTELLKGHWHFVYTIISTFTDDYNLTTIPGTTNSQGGYFIHGTDQYGGPVVASYFPKDGNWALSDPGTIIDQFYVFYTDGASILPNSCYYQINPPGSTNFSRCYQLTGVKTAAAAAARARQYESQRLPADEARIQEHENFALESAPVAADVLEKYWMLKAQ